MAARGYPGVYAQHTVIGGMAAAEAVAGVTVFHAGTDVRDGVLVSSGGRVLTVVGMASDLATARDAAYAGVDALAVTYGAHPHEVLTGFPALAILGSVNELSLWLKKNA